MSRVSSSAAFRTLKLIFSFPVTLAALLLVLAVLTVRSRFDDPDMWWHLRVGQIIWTTHTIPTTDLFSFTTNHHAWIPHEWLSQLLIFSSWKLGGFTGMMVGLCIFSAAVFIAGYALCTVYSKNVKVAFLGALVVFVFSTVGLSIRPQLIGYLLLIFELIVIQLGRTRNPRWFWLLPPLFAVWINCHGSFFLGIILAGVLLFSSYFQFQIGSLSSERWSTQLRKQFLFAMLASVAALFLNPVGIRQILYPLDTLIHQPIGLSVVQEWQPLQLNSQRGVLLLVVLTGIVLLAIARKSELRFEELLFLAIGTWLAGSHDRMLFVFGILVAPTLSRMLATFWDGYNAETDRIMPNAAMLALALLVAFLSFPKAEALTRQVETNSPAKAVEFVQSHHLTGPMLNSYTYGGYLIWTMPEHPVFIDGRADVFEWTGVFQEFSNWATLQADPNVLPDKYNVQFCLLTPDAPFTRAMLLTRNWKSIYRDANAEILVRTTSANPIH